VPSLLAAEHYQRPDDLAIQIAEQRESRITKAIAAGLAALGTALDHADLKGMIASGNTIGLATILGGPGVADALKQAYKPVADTFVDAAEAETAGSLGGLVVYDPLVAAAQLAGAQQTFIGSILGPAADVVRQQLLQALRLGADPAEIAGALKQVIGLTPRDALALSNYRRMLENGDPQALVRALRDPRFDPIVRSIVDGAPAKQETVDRLVLASAERRLMYRAQTIAQQESLQAAVGGIRDAYVQAVGGGRLRESEVTRFWQVTIDERLCPICASIPLLNPRGVTVFQPYMSADGPIMAPLAHVNCRCSEKYVTDLSRVSANPFTGAPAPGVRRPAQLPPIQLPAIPF